MQRAEQQHRRNAGADRRFGHRHIDRVERDQHGGHQEAVNAGQHDHGEQVAHPRQHEHDKRHHHQQDIDDQGFDDAALPLARASSGLRPRSSAARASAWLAVGLAKNTSRPMMKPA
jgi:hypothetical protein